MYLLVVLVQADQILALEKLEDQQAQSVTQTQPQW